MPKPTASDILEVLTTAGRPATRQIAERIEGEIARYGDLACAVAALTHEDAPALLSDMLAYRAALAEAADPRLRIARLRREADDLDARAEPLWLEAADCAGRARFRRSQGQGELAAIFERKTQAAERLAAALETESFAKRLEAAHLQIAYANQDHWAGLLAVVAA